MKKSKISLDYDSTLSTKDVQDFARELIADGHDVWVTTTRTNTEDALSRGHHWVEEQNNKMFGVLDSCGIRRDKVVFTDHANKAGFLEGKDFIFHLDDYEVDILFIEESDDLCIAVDVNFSDWKDRCKNILSGNLCTEKKSSEDKNYRDELIQVIKKDKMIFANNKLYTEACVLRSYQRLIENLDVVSHNAFIEAKIFLSEIYRLI